jgi:hypothetical protein
MLTNDELRKRFRTSLPTILKLRDAAAAQKFIRVEGSHMNRRLVLLNDDGSDGAATAWRVIGGVVEQFQGVKGSEAHAPALRPALITIKSAAQAVGGMTLAEVRLGVDLWAEVRTAARDAGQSPSAFLQSIIPLALDRWRGEQRELAAEKEGRR